MSVITKRGDDGHTDLMFGKRALKTCDRLETYGTVDELNAHLGVVRQSPISQKTIDIIDEVQARLVGLMGEMATLEEDLERYDAKGYRRIIADDVAWIEACSHQLEEEGSIKFRDWSRPGKEGNMGSAQLDLARTVCRRAERRIVGLKLSGDLSNDHSALFLNRLSDLLWILARYEALLNHQ